MLYLPFCGNDILLVSVRLCLLSVPRYGMLGDRGQIPFLWKEEKNPRVSAYRFLWRARNINLARINLGFGAKEK